MLSYLVKYDASVENIHFQESLDITDKHVLEKQINIARMSVYGLIKLFDDLNKDKIEAQAKLTAKKQELYKKHTNRLERADIMLQDNDITKLNEIVSAISSGQEIVKMYLDAAKSDIRILANAQYNKF